MGPHKFGQGLNGAIDGKQVSVIGRISRTQGEQVVHVAGMVIYWSSEASGGWYKAHEACQTAASVRLPGGACIV